MAILIKSGDRKISWPLIIGLVLFVVFLLASTYYLFFSPAPLAENLFKTDIERETELKSINIDKKEVDKALNYPDGKRIFRSEDRIAVPKLDNPGRPNPFLPF